MPIESADVCYDRNLDAMRCDVTSKLSSLAHLPSHVLTRRDEALDDARCASVIIHVLSLEESSYTPNASQSQELLNIISMAGVESEVKSEVKPEDGGMAETKQEESEVKPEKTGISAFERKRLENIAANQALLKDLSTTANKVIPKPPPKPAAAPKKRRREAPAPRESTRPTRTSSRLAGIEADDEVARRKAEENAEVAREETKAKRTRISGDLNLSDVAVGGKGLSDLTGIVRGAQPYERTFNEEDIQETTDVDLKSLREKMSGLKLYENWLPNGRFFSSHWAGSRLTW